MPILLLLFFISAFALAAPASKEEILSAEGEQQIILLNEYLKQHAHTDARGALALIEQIDPSAERDPHSKASVELDLWKGVAFKYVGRKQDALEFMNRAVSQSRLRSYLELQGEALKQRAYFYMEQSKFKLALEDAVAAYALVESREDMNELPVISVLIGDIHNDQALYSISYKWYQEAHAQYQQVGDQLGEIRALDRIGSTFRAVGDFDNALHYRLQAVEGQLKYGSKRGQATVLNNTATIYKDLGRYDEAIEMHKRSLALKEELGYERGMVYSYNNLGETYRLSGDFKSAKLYLHKAQELATKLDNPMLLGATNLYLGRIALAESRYQDAERFLTDAMYTYRRRNSVTRLAEGLTEQANLAFAQEQYNKAETLYMEAIDYAQQSQKNVVLLNAYESLSQMYAELNNYKSAFEMQKRYQASRDSLFDANSQQRIEMLIVQNQIQETQRHLSFLKQQAQLTESKLKHKIANRNLMILGVLTLVALVGYFYSRRVHKRELALLSRSHAAIAEKEQKLSLALWASGDVLWSWDVKNKIISRENAGRLDALPEGQVDPSWETYRSFVHEDDFDRLIAQLEAVKSNQEDAFEVSYRVKNKAGEWAWVQDKGKVVETDESGAPKKVAGIQHDITILKQQEADLVVLNTELEMRVKQRTHDLVETLDKLKVTQQSLVEAEKMAALGALVAGLAHEINTPLGTAMTAITHLEAELAQLKDKIASQSLTKSNLQSGLDGITSGKDIVLKGVERAIGLVQQFKRVSVSGTETEVAKAPFGELVETAFRCAKSNNGDPDNIELCVNQDGEVATYLDPLMQVLELLLSNAIQHAKPKTGLIIHAAFHEYDTYFEVAIEDNGVGVEADIRNKIFEPFYTSMRHAGSVGLGLNIVFNLVVQLLGGEIHCEASQLGGAKFRFSIAKNVDKVSARSLQSESE